MALPIHLCTCCYILAPYIALAPGAVVDDLVSKNIAVDTEMIAADLACIPAALIMDWTPRSPAPRCMLLHWPCTGMASSITDLRNSIVVKVLRGQISRARHSSTEQLWRCLAAMSHDMLYYRAST